MVSLGQGRVQATSEERSRRSASPPHPPTARVRPSKNGRDACPLAHSTPPVSASRPDRRSGTHNRESVVLENLGLVLPFVGNQKRRRSLGRREEELLAARGAERARVQEDLDACVVREKYETPHA